MSRRVFFSTILGGVAVAAAFGIYLSTFARAGAAGGITYVAINPNVFVSRRTAAGWAATHNEKAVSAHAVALWNGLTAPAKQSFRGVSLAVYDTWYTPCEIYPVTAKCGKGIIHLPTILDLEPPEQFFHTPRVTGNDILSGVRYDAFMKDFVDEGYGGASYSSGAGLINAINAGEKDLVDTAAPQAMMLKPTYELFSSTQPTVITYWEGPGLNVPLGASSSPLVPDYSTWLKVAVIDPTGKATNAKPVSFCANTIDPSGAIVSSYTYVAPARSYKVIPLKQFYAIPLSSTELSIIAANRAELVQRRNADLVHRYGMRINEAKPGCKTTTPPNPVAALIGMHVVSAELKDVWTWQTFWWNPTVKPIPGARAQFRYFDYATAYWKVDKPPYGWRYAFNPYLEADFGTATFLNPAWPPAGKPGSVINLGRTTNCISCHEAAKYTVAASPSPGPGYVAHDSEPQLALPQSILTRNLWSLAIRAGHPSPGP